MPDKYMVKNWAKKTPDNFRFTAKFPKIITHDKHLVDVDEEVYTFLNNMEPLQGKALALLIQLPPSMRIMPGLVDLKELVRLLDRGFRYAVEADDRNSMQINTSKLETLQEPHLGIAKEDKVVSQNL
jgi:uncharacterized protein YecE (DUF72 family)